MPNRGTHVCKPRNRGNNVSRFVHDDHCTGPQTGLSVLEGIIVHPGVNRHKSTGWKWRGQAGSHVQHLSTHVLGNHRNRASTRDDT